MSGHSKWANIRRKKEAMDARRGQLFTKVARELTAAAREGGGDPEGNFRLRLAVEKAKQANMPRDSIEKAIQRGTGELKGEALEEVLYEGYAPHGVAVLLATLTDNRNRAVADVRRFLSHAGGSLAETGSVTWLFEQKGLIVVETGGGGAEELALMAIDLGADDVKVGDGLVEIYTRPQDLKKVKEALESKGIDLTVAELTMMPKSYAQLPETETIQTMHLIESLEELDDVQRVYTNLDIPAEIMEHYGEE